MHPISGSGLRTLFFLLTFALNAALASGEPRLEQFAEKQVAGSKDDFMIVRHFTLRGSNEAIGWKLAEIAKTGHGVEPAGKASEQTQKRWQFYKSQYPTQYARAVGAAGFFGAPVDGPADTLALWFDMDIAPACSVVYYPPAFTQTGHPTLSRNYDFTTSTFAELKGGNPPPGARPMTADPYVIEMYPNEGYASLYVCAYDLLGGCIDGINSEGLTVALLANEAQRDGMPPTPSAAARAGLSEIEIPRFLLDRCKSVDEARGLLMHVPVYYSFIPCHYIIGDRSGNSIIWEYSNDLKERHVVDGNGVPQVITNHQVYKSESDHTTSPSWGSGNSFVRYSRLQTEIAKSPKGRSIEEIKRTSACVKASSPAGTRAPDGPVRLNRTLWHSIYDCADRSMEVDFYLGEDGSAPAKEKRSGYLRFKLEPAASVAVRKSQG